MLVDTNYNKVSQARLEGLEAHCMNILNEHAREDLPLAGIGRFLAMTPNDEVNSLAVRECRTMFDRARLFQLTFTSQNTHARRGMTRNLMGRQLFGEGLTFSQIRDRHIAGARFKSTKLSDEFSYEEFVQMYGADVPVLCTLSEGGALSIMTVDDHKVPVSGQTVVAMVSSTPVPSDHPAKS